MADAKCVWNGGLRRKIIVSTQTLIRVVRNVAEGEIPNNFVSIVTENAETNICGIASA